MIATLIDSPYPPRRAQPGRRRLVDPPAGRIEDDAVVTADGCEFITDEAPRSVADIEAVMREAQA